jgi:hypothetical protein
MKGYILLASLFFISLFQSAYAAKDCELWWENNLENTVSYATFREWLGNVNAESRVAMRNHIKKMGYKSLVDVPSGLCLDYWGLKKEEIQISYLGVDITSKLVKLAVDQSIPVIRGSIESLPLSDNQFDVSYARHILEHLDSYERAINELIRVGRKETLIVFFIKPEIDSPDQIKPCVIDGYVIFHNIYNKTNLEKFVLSNPKTSKIEWEDVNDKETILHIYLK